MTRSQQSLPRLACFSATLRRAERAVYRLYADALRDTGLEPTQFTLLKFVRGNAGITHGELAGALALDPTTLSRTLRRLLSDGLVAAREGDDRRVRHYSVTAVGERVLGEAAPGWESAQNQVEELFGPDTVSRLMEDLARVADGAA